MELQNVVTGQHLTAVQTLVEKVIQWIINFSYSFIDILVWIVTKPAVLSMLAVLFIMYWAYRKFIGKVGRGVL